MGSSGTCLPCWTFPFHSHILQSAEIRSKHGIILSCSLVFPEGAEESMKEHLAVLAMRLKGQRYGFVDDSIKLLAKEDDRVAAVWEWLGTEMDS